MKIKISKRTIDALKAGEAITDSELAGFRARRWQSGIVTFEYRYRLAGARKYVALGQLGAITPDEARKAAQKHAGALANGRELAAEQTAQVAAEVTKRENNSRTVNAMLDDFQTIYLDGARSAQAYISAFKHHVRPVIGETSIYLLSRRQISEMLDKAASGGERGGGVVMADRVLAYFRKACNWQVARDERFVSPVVKGMARTKPSERRGQRILSDDEIADVLAAVDQLKPGKDVPACYPRYIRALLLTAQRRTNVARLHSDEIEGKNWIIPGERFKNKMAQLVPIEFARSAIGYGSGFMFSSDGGATAFGGFSKAKAALNKQIAALRKAAGRKAMPHFKLHDLRRTARSIMSRYTSPDIAERVIGHVIPGVRGVYDLYDYESEKRLALKKLAAHIGRLDRGATVIRLAKVG